MQEIEMSPTDFRPGPRVLKGLSGTLRKVRGKEDSFDERLHQSSPGFKHLLHE